jgi:uncharacterized protein YlzI (FlbEa/FlbD family)
MIILTRLGGHALAVNPDLIERAEATPDTVITLVDGHKLVIAESVEEVVGRVRSWRAGITAAAYRAVTDAELLGAGDDAAEAETAEDEANRADRIERLTAVAGLGGRVLPISRKEG